MNIVKEFVLNVTEAFADVGDGRQELCTQQHYRNENLNIMLRQKAVEKSGRIVFYTKPQILP